MKSFRIILTVPLIATTIMLFSSTALAHQSGCHRWHSCPSDTGSYVCGDLGYYSECGEETTYYADYTEQGTDNGQETADDNSSSIKSAAISDAKEAGLNDGISENSDSPDPDASLTCDIDFTYESPQPDEYVEAFHDAYLDSCTQIYDDAFSEAYETAYQDGVNQNSDNAANAVNLENSSDTNASSIYWILGAAALVGLPYFVSSVRKK
jgi:hypothetical protein